LFPGVPLHQNIVGNAMRMAVVQLQVGQTVYCEAGEFLFRRRERDHGDPAVRAVRQ